VKNYYLRLLIGMAATPDEVRRAYYRLAREHHPDAASGSAASFVELREAYDVLGTETKRAQYDEQRRAWAKRDRRIPLRLLWHRKPR
jgi:DnaJ-class molecular chaperone